MGGGRGSLSISSTQSVAIEQIPYEQLLESIILQGQILDKATPESTFLQGRSSQFPNALLYIMPIQRSLQGSIPDGQYTAQSKLYCVLSEHSGWSLLPACKVSQAKEELQ